MKRLSTLLLIVASAFAQTAPTAPAKKAAPAAPAKKEAAAPEPERAPGLYAIMKTTMGTITAELYEKETPGAVNNFVGLAKGTKSYKNKAGAMVKGPYYTNLLFHRVIPGFMIQTGDVAGDGSSDCGFTIKDEIVPTLKYDKPGRLGLARLDSPNTGACQFFITDAPYPSLSGQYTIFGQVVEGQDLVGKIAAVPRDGNDKPRTPVKLISVTIKRYGPAPATAAPAKKAAPAGGTPAPKKAATPAAPVKK
ncbi:MAG: Peptidylprolyl isomerase [Candidatus Solibacter sp.]|nr:Peptidylprolyl isomerase [Candidatus Solibacter sp.]